MLTARLAVNRYRDATGAAVFVTRAVAAMRRCSPASTSLLLATIVLLVAPAASINLKWPGKGGGRADHGQAGVGGGGAQLAVLFPRDGQVQQASSRYFVSTEPKKCIRAYMEFTDTDRIPLSLTDTVQHSDNYFP